MTGAGKVPEGPGRTRGALKVLEGWAGHGRWAPCSRLELGLRSAFAGPEVRPYPLEQGSGIPRAPVSHPNPKACPPMGCLVFAYPPSRPSPGYRHLQPPTKRPLPIPASVVSFFSPFVLGWICCHFPGF